MNLQTWLIQKVIHINEGIIFYPKLKKFYKSKFESKIKSGNEIRIIDVGTNKGQSIDFFLGISKKTLIWGFEPNLRLYKGLIEKYKSNANIALKNNGVSSKIGKLLFQENVLDETSTFEQINYDSQYLKHKAKVLGVTPENIIVDKYEVDVTTLGSFLQEHKGAFFDLLKIDVEGHEYDCLLGLFDSAGGTYPIRFIQLEDHKDDMYVHNHDKEISQLLAQNGFERTIAIKHGFGDFYEVVYENTRLK